MNNTDNDTKPVDNMADIELSLLSLASLLKNLTPASGGQHTPEHCMVIANAVDTVALSLKALINYRAMKDKSAMELIISGISAKGREEINLAKCDAVGSASCGNNITEQYTKPYQPTEWADGL